MAAVAGDRVYAWDLIFSDIVVSVFNAATGEKLYSSGPLPTGIYGTQIGLMTGPNSMVYAPLASGSPADTFVALQDTGTSMIQKWRVPLGYVPFASFGIGPDGSVYSYSRAGQVLRLDPETGAVRNTSIPIGEGFLYAPRMAIDRDGKVFVTSNGFDGGALLSFNADLTLRWTDSVPGVSSGGPTLSHNGTLVVCGSEIRAYKPGEIAVDGDPADWAGISPLITDAAGDVPPGTLDFTRLFVTNNARNVYFLLEFANDYATYNTSFPDILLDTDMDSNTGCSYGSIGGVLGLEVGLFFGSPHHDDLLRDMTDCFISPSYPVAITSVFKGRFLEVSVPIDTLKTFTPGLTGFDLRVDTSVGYPIARYLLR